MKTIPEVTILSSSYRLGSSICFLLLLRGLKDKAWVCRIAPAGGDGTLGHLDEGALLLGKEAAHLGLSKLLVTVHVPGPTFPYLVPSF